MDVVDRILSGPFPTNVAIVTRTLFPKVCLDQAAILRDSGWALFDRLEDFGHAVDLV